MNCRRKKGQSREPVQCKKDTAEGRKIKDEEIVSIIREVLSGECSCYGYKKVTAHLRVFYKIKINKKKVYRLMRF
jgi:putative transposase